MPAMPGRLPIAVLVFVAALAPVRSQSARPIVLDAARIVDGTGAPPIRAGRIVIHGDRITQVGTAASVAVPSGAEHVDLGDRTVLPGLIDLHFHIEADPALALRQLSHGVTSFRDPGQWEEKFARLRQMIAADGLPAPRIFTAGPHIDGERPAYPADAVVARDADEARRFAERNIADGATALKIYFRLPMASARAVIDVCHQRRVPCTAHLEILDARELIAAGLDGVEHITSLGPSLLPRLERERYRQAVLADNDARRDGRYGVFSRLDLEGAEARALYDVVRTRGPWVDPTLAVFERRASAPPKGASAEQVKTFIAGFEAMKQLTRRVAREGARVVVGGHSEVPFAGRGEAPWREMELLVESGFTPLEAIHAATGEAAAFLFRESDLGALQPGRLADLIVVPDDPAVRIEALRRVERVMASGAWIDVAKYRQY
jgi:imidazolonepropionase-like amidohydrolase